MAADVEDGLREQDENNKEKNASIINEAMVLRESYSLGVCT
jgi:hypothetical protein